MAKPIFLRFKLPGARVLEVDVSIIKTFQIELMDDDSYSLIAFSSSQQYTLCNGSFDDCHYLLNELHDVIGITIVDVEGFN